MRKIAAFVIGLLGLAQGVGGIWLIALGGSPYFFIAAVVQIAGAYWLWRAHRYALVAFHALLIGTIVWAFWDTGGAFWGVLARTAFVFVLWIIAVLAARGTAPQVSTSG
jgi:quinoprotein glucose dehydrogenase